MGDSRRTNPVKIKIDHIGCGTLEIGGRKLENYSNAFEIVSQVGDVPRIKVSVVATEGLEIEMDALVDIEVTHLYPKEEKEEVTLP